MALFKDSFNYQELIDCAKGKLAGVDFPKLPLPPMLMFDEVTNIKESSDTLDLSAANYQNIYDEDTDGGSNFYLDGALINTAIAKAKKPIVMAEAIKFAVISGRKSFLSGRIKKNLYGFASTPNKGII